MINLFLNNQNIVENTTARLYDIYGLKIGNRSLAQLIEYLPGFGADQHWDIVKAVMILISLILVAFLVKINIDMKSLMGKKPSLAAQLLPPEAAESASNARWEEIQKHINSTHESEWKFAVIEADNLIEDTLKSAGFPGEGLGDRLMQIDKSKLVTIDTLWDAHKIRNRLVHDSNYFLRYTEAKRAINLFEKTLRELGAI